MFSHFEKQNRCLAFRTDSHEFARNAVYRFAETTLNAWLQGQERLYAVRDVQREIRAVFGIGGEEVAAMIGRATTAPEETRPAIITEAVQCLAKLLRGNPAEME